MARGGLRPNAGRPKGSNNKSTVSQKATISELAREYAPDALRTLASVMKDDGQTGSARVAAANALLDRAYGRPKEIPADPEDAAPMAITINTAAPIGEIRVTRSDG